ncbi:MAG: hypothetical protein KFF49_11805 [Bacteroidales bacterium]|nr:hypothetical protein [Bacteroidales bacterium]
MRAPGRILLLLILTFITSSCSVESYRIEFTELDTGTGASIRALHVVSEDIIWASGTGGTFLLTTDGGESWKVDTVPGASGDDFRSIHAWNENEALLFGISNPGRGYISHDGGDKWEIVYENETSGIFFNSIDFADDNKGMALSDPVDSTSFVIRTEDSGRTWTSISGLPVLKEGEYNFAASNSCTDYHADGKVWIITGGANARVFLSDNHGYDWKAIETGMISGNPSSGIFSVSFCDYLNGIVVGGTYDKPELNDKIAAFSSDGGKSWKLSGNMPSGFRSSVIWLADKKKTVAFALGKTACSYSLDKGKTWRAGPAVEGYYTARPVPGTMTGFAAGSDGKIAKFHLSIK